MFSLNLKLEALKDSAAQYVCLEGHRHMNYPVLSEGGIAPPMTLLVQSQHLVCQILGAEEDQAMPTKKKQKHNFVVKLEEGRTTRFRIFEKGNMLFPERFESALLASRIVYNNIIYVPSMEEEYWALMYIRLIHQGALMTEPGKDLSWRSVMLEKVKERVGHAVSPRYEVGFFPNIN